MTDADRDGLVKKLNGLNFDEARNMGVEIARLFAEKGLSFRQAEGVLDYTKDLLKKESFREEVSALILDKINRLCAERQISIAALERESGLKNATICKWRNSVPRVDSLKKVADYLGVSIDDLLEEDTT